MKFPLKMSTNTYYAIYERVRQFVSNFGYLQMCVQILHKQYYYRIKTFPLGPTDTIKSFLCIQIVKGMCTMS